MNKTFLIIALFVFTSLTSANKLESFSTLWSTWKTKHAKFYSTTEELVRFGIFVENLEKIAKLNSESNTAKFTINKFADLTPTEFGLRYASSSFFESRVKITETNTHIDLPDSVDWREKGAVTPVKDHKQCGAS